MGRAVNTPREYGMTLDQVREWVEDSCAAQGVPVLVSDPAVVARVGVLLGAERRAPLAGARSAPTAATSARRGRDPGPGTLDG